MTGGKIFTCVAISAIAYYSLRKRKIPQGLKVGVAIASGGITLMKFVALDRVVDNVERKKLYA